MNIANGKKSRKDKDVRYDIQLTEEQKNAKTLILNCPFNFVLGGAGSGKTLLACAIGLDLLFKKIIRKMVVTRPTVSTEDNGFLPGSMEEKMEPWLIPIYSNLTKIYNKPNILEKLYNEKNIELVSLTHFRGRTFEDSVCIVDEFQNLTKTQLHMVISRLGKNSIMILTGDYKQIDLKNKNDSAVYVVDRLVESEHVSKITLLENHRHPSLNDVLALLSELI